MYDSILSVLLTLGAIGAGLMAGVYFAFSGFIMQSFDRLGPRQATAAMNAINEVILRSWFMPLFFGSSLLYLVLALMALIAWDKPNSLLLVVAGITYVAGMFVCTALFNVPLNNRLAAAGKDSVDLSEPWSDYLHRWTRWNHLRAICSLIACAISLYLLTA